MFNLRQLGIIMIRLVIHNWYRLKYGVTPVFTVSDGAIMQEKTTNKNVISGQTKLQIKPTSDKYFYKLELNVFAEDGTVSLKTVDIALENDKANFISMKLVSLGSQMIIKNEVTGDYETEMDFDIQSYQNFKLKGTILDFNISENAVLLDAQGNRIYNRQTYVKFTETAPSSQIFETQLKLQSEDKQTVRDIKLRLTMLNGLKVFLSQNEQGKSFEIQNLITNPGSTDPQIVSGGGLGYKFGLNDLKELEMIIPKRFESRKTTSHAFSFDVKPYSSNKGQVYLFGDRAIQNASIGMRITYKDEKIKLSLKGDNTSGNHLGEITDVDLSSQKWSTIGINVDREEHNKLTLYVNGEVKGTIDIPDNQEILTNLERMRFGLDKNEDTNVRFMEK